nr:MAG TPA: hypothetical protein [Caudoviricetes sp.]
MTLKDQLIVKPVLCGNYIVSEEVIQRNEDLNLIVNIDKNNSEEPSLVKDYIYETNDMVYCYTGIWQRLPHKRFVLIFRPYYRKEGK